MLGNTTTITNNVTQVLAKSIDYQDLLHQLEREQKLFDLTPETEQEERLKISAGIDELTNRLEQFKEDVLRLAEQFNRIEINTDRLMRAKEFFDKGEIGEARAVLECEVEQMQDEQRALLIKQEEYQQNTLPKLQANAEEFLILALSTQTHYDNPHWFADSCRYFECSIKSHPNKVNVFQYAYFLKDHNKLAKAETYYKRYLNDFAFDISIQERAMTLNNLAILHSDQNRYEEALKEYEEALQIRRQLAEANPHTYLPDVAMTLNNLANLHSAQNRYEKALKEYEEALQIRRQLAEANPHTYLPAVAMTSINLAIFYLQALPNREKSIELTLDAIKIVLPIVEKVPYTELYLQRAIAVLKAWDLSKEEIEQLITENEE